VEPGTGRTALHQAALRGDQQFIRFLLLRGANRQAIDAAGHTPLEVAEMAQKRAAAAMLLQGATEPAQD